MAPVRKRDDIDDAFKLLRGEFDNAALKTEFPPGGRPIEKKYYAATARVLEAFAEKLMFNEPLDVLLMDMAGLSQPDDKAKRDRERLDRAKSCGFLMELAAAFDPTGKTKRKITVGFRNNDATSDIGREVIIALEVSYRLARGVPKEKAYQQVADLAGYRDKRQVRNYYKKFEKECESRDGFPDMYKVPEPNT